MDRFQVPGSASPLATDKPVKSKKKLYSFIRELRVADLAHPSVRPRPRPRTRFRPRSVWQGILIAIVFDYEDEHDDEDDLNTLRMASQGGRPHFDFAIY
jgi:hypothetical protein